MIKVATLDYHLFGSDTSTISTRNLEGTINKMMVDRKTSKVIGHDGQASEALAEGDVPVTKMINLKSNSLVQSNFRILYMRERNFQTFQIETKCVGNTFQNFTYR